MEPPRVAQAEATPFPSAGSPSGGLFGRYATALYEFADAPRRLAETAAQAPSRGRLIDQSAPLRSLLSNPTLDLGQSARAARAVLEEQGFGVTLRHFVGVVASNRRLSMLRAILAAFAVLVAARRGITVAEISSAHPLTDLQRTQLRARLTEAGYGRVDIREQVDSELLGGLIVRVGARLYDTSVRSRLTRLNHAMKGAA